MSQTLASPRVNDFVLNIATQNGSGSQSANQLIVKTLFRMGLPVSGKNLFPSNIQGLPTWFTIRANPEGFISRKITQDLVVTLNASTAVNDQKALKPGGVFLYSTDCKLKPEQIRQDLRSFAVPFRDLVGPLSDSVKTKKLLTNMIYVGILSELLPLPKEILRGTVEDHYKHKESLVEANCHAVEAGRAWAREALKDHVGETPTHPLIRAATIANGNRDYYLIDGNTSAGMGFVDGGCSFAAWYPITPSSSVMESFQTYADLWRTEANGEKRVAIVQTEDELASICMTLGAGWAGARAVTATSGPGLSLMSEAAGLIYFGEIPAVIWNVQRAGPSTGLPTRTMQGDVQSAATLSHGDTRHVLLFPRDPSECFTFGRIAFDLAEELQTLVVVLSDLDIGMNLHRTPKWQVDPSPLKRGKVLTAKDLDQVSKFARYADADGDGVGPRTLPGTPHPLASYFTRGTGHDEESRYSEDPMVFSQNLDRLARKMKTAQRLAPQPELDQVKGAAIGLIAYGSSDLAMSETRAQLSQKGFKTHYMRIKAFPFSQSVQDFIQNCERVYVVEQNRDGQLRQMIAADFPNLAPRVHSVVQYDGWPLAAENIAQVILNQEFKA